MNDIKNRVGYFKRGIVVSCEFAALAKSDEAAALVLAEHRQYRQACYCLLQAMEKWIRSKIFTIVNADIEYFRSKNKSHSVESAIEFLLEIIAPDDLKRRQVMRQLKEYVLGDIHYAQVHNNLRYPYFSEKHQNHSLLEVKEDDFNALKQRLDRLKLFLADINGLA